MVVNKVLPYQGGWFSYYTSVCAYLAKVGMKADIRSSSPMQRRLIREELPSATGKATTLRWRRLGHTVRTSFHSI